MEVEESIKAKIKNLLIKKSLVNLGFRLVAIEDRPQIEDNVLAVYLFVNSTRSRRFQTFSKQT